MLKLDCKAFNSLGQHVKMPSDHVVKSVDLHTGDAVLVEGKGLFVHRRKVFTQDEMQAAVSAGVADRQAHRPDWRIADHPALDAWLKYEQVGAPAVDEVSEPIAADAPPEAATPTKKRKR